jgi:hypothetical protein
VRVTSTLFRLLASPLQSPAGTGNSPSRVQRLRQLLDLKEMVIERLKVWRRYDLRARAHERIALPLGGRLLRELWQTWLGWFALDQAFFEATEIVLEHAGPGARCFDTRANLPTMRSVIGCVFYKVVEVVSERCGSETHCSTIGMALPALWFNLDHTLSEIIGLVLERTSSRNRGAAVGVDF